MRYLLLFTYVDETEMKERKIPIQLQIETWLLPLRDKQRLRQSFSGRGKRNLLVILSSMSSSYSTPS